MRKLFFLFFVLSETAVYYNNVLRFDLHVKSIRILHLILKEWMTRADDERMIDDDFRVECLPSHNTSRLGWFTGFKFFSR